VVTDTNSSHVGGRHLLSHGVPPLPLRAPEPRSGCTLLTLGSYGDAGGTCGTAINLASYYYPGILGAWSSDKTNFLTSCGSGYDAVFYYSLAAGATIAFDPPSTYYHNTHEIRYGGSCPGTSQSACAYASSRVSYRNTGSTSVDVYYIQSGFSSTDSALNVVWTGNTWYGESSTHFSRSSGQSRGAAV